jgi:hypothetical protein
MLLQYFNFKKKNLAKKTWVMGKNAIGTRPPWKEKVAKKIAT